MACKAVRGRSVACKVLSVDDIPPPNTLIPVRGLAQRSFSRVRTGAAHAAFRPAVQYTRATCFGRAQTTACKAVRGHSTACKVLSLDDIPPPNTLIPVRGLAQRSFSRVRTGGAHAAFRPAVQYTRATCFGRAQATACKAVRGHGTACKVLGLGAVPSPNTLIPVRDLA